MRATAVDAVVGRNVEACRAHRRMTQAQLAAAVAERGHVGFNRMAVSLLERGERSVSVGELDSLADVLGLEPVALLNPRLLWSP